MSNIKRNDLVRVNKERYKTWIFPDQNIEKILNDVVIVIKTDDQGNVEVLSQDHGKITVPMILLMKIVPLNELKQYIKLLIEGLFKRRTN